MTCEQAMSELVTRWDWFCAGMATGILLSHAGDAIQKAIHARVTRHDLERTKELLEFVKRLKDQVGLGKQ